MSTITTSEKLAVESALARVRHRCLQRNGRVGIKDLSRLVRMMDDKNSSRLDSDELRTCIREIMGLCIPDEDFALIIKAFDAEGHGISIDEFLIGIRGPLSLRRKTAIEAAYYRIDSDHKGYIDINDMKACLDVSRHPNVIAGRSSPEEMVNKYLSNFDNPTNPDGIVTFEDFINYYVGVSSNMESDEHFELLMIRTWALDRPSKSLVNVNTAVRSITGGRGLESDGGISRKNHPLYQSTSMSYGSTIDKHKMGVMHNRPGAFTKNAPPCGGSTGLNFGSTKKTYM
eukprot:Tbor_TRINITY_DN5840_c0_g1::TRINITY_DN5840_c0_g1_i14::g.5976::m.5976